MALPSDTDWDLSYDEYGLSAGAQVRTTVPLVVVRNMDYSLRCSRMLSSHVWAPKSSAAGGYTTLFTGYSYGPNVLGTSVSSDIAGTVRAWTDDGTTAFSVRVYNAAYGTLTAAVAAGASAQLKIWRGWMTGTFTAPGDDTIWSYTVDVAVTAGYGTVYLAGVGLFY